MLKGSNKKEYQKEYMKKRRALQKGVTEPEGVTPTTPKINLPTVTPKIPIPISQKDIDSIPKYIKDSIAITVSNRKALGLSDDGKERLEAAAEYAAWRKEYLEAHPC